MKASISLDAIIALAIILFTVSWIQGYARTMAGNADSYGASLSVKSAALDAGSRMNAFYSWIPGPNDYVVVSGQIRLFDKTENALISKLVTSAFANVSVLYRGTLYNSTYPVPVGLYQQPGTGKVRR